MTEILFNHQPWRDRASCMLRYRDFRSFCTSSIMKTMTRITPLIIREPFVLQPS